MNDLTELPHSAVFLLAALTQGEVVARKTNHKTRKSPPVDM